MTQPLDDPEIKAMHEPHGRVRDLDDDARTRLYQLLGWLDDIDAKTVVEIVLNQGWTPPESKGV